MNFTEYLHHYQTHINKVLTQYLPTENTEPQNLHKAMHYAVLNGGKRIRPLLMYATGEIFNIPLKKLDPAASAVEMIHCYSLVHDDLPAMDNDDLRRGQPTCHKAFDEATAILAGDALQSLAFKILTENNTPEIALKMLITLADACGSDGMAGGQALDLQAVGKKLTLQQLETLHRLKTGALIRASIKLPAIIAECSTKQATALDKFANDIGLAFQIKDDILDIESTTETLGKRQGADIAHNKTTYPLLVGMQTAKQQVKTLHENANKQLQIFGNQANSLKLLADYIVERNH